MCFLAVHLLFYAVNNLLFLDELRVCTCVTVCVCVSEKTYNVCFLQS